MSAEDKLQYQSNDLLIFGGAYSNIQATQRLKDIATLLKFPSAQIICTGDVVGYCGNPEETVNLIRDWNIHVIAGNVETQLRSGQEDCGCNFDEGSRCDLFSRSWFPFAQKHLSPESINWMKELPLQKSMDWCGNKITIIHGGIEDISEFIFESSPSKRKEKLLAETNSQILLAGHCGLPFSQNLENGKWINAGVIGMPANDGTTRCWFAILRAVDQTVELHSFDYNYKETNKRMLEQNLPKEYAETLVTGLWDNCEILPESETKNQGQRIQEDYHWNL